MFELVKPKDRQNAMKCSASLLLSVMIHALILCAIVTVPLIFCNSLHLEDSVIGIVSLYSLPAPISLPAPAAAIMPPAPPHYGSPRAANTTKAGTGNAITAIPEFTALTSIPDGIVPEPPPIDWFGDGPKGDGGFPGGGGSFDGPIGGASTVIASMSTSFTKDKPPIPRPPLSPTVINDVTPLQVISILQASKLIYKVDPVYPPLAIKAHVEGTVALTAFIDEEGNVSDVRVLRGHVLLKDASVQAVKQWKYSPTVLSGEPVPVQALVDVIFTLK
jgi:periplasmic protein TonB